MLASAARALQVSSVGPVAQESLDASPSAR
jgi:hypothetical protein